MKKYHKVKKNNNIICYTSMGNILHYDSGMQKLNKRGDTLEINKLGNFGSTNYSNKSCLQWEYIFLKMKKMSW